jgi:hypothetical protein
MARLLAALAQDLGSGIPTVRELRGGLHAHLEGEVLLVPQQFVKHWLRFGILPTALIRDVAYASKRRQLLRTGATKASSVEADAMAYAERFLRAVAEPD